MNSAHSIVRATRDYEAWLASQVRVVRPGLQAKHKVMEEDGCWVVESLEPNARLSSWVTVRLRDPTQFWRKLAARPVVRDVPTEVRSLLEAALPEVRLELRMVYRQPGLASLGRPRFTALAEWRGGKVAREAKALVPSAWLWAASTAGN